MTFVDTTITVGNIIEIGVIMIGGVGAFLTIKSSVINMKEDLVNLKDEMKKIGEVLIKMAVTDERLTHVEDDIRDLRHGRGYVIHRSHNGINGEYP